MLSYQGSIPGRDKRFFSTASSQAVGRAQPPNQSVPGALSPGVKRQGHEADHFFHLVPRRRMGELYLHSPVCLRGLVLNYIIKYKW
jgi:hypothetical protein